MSLTQCPPLPPDTARAAESVFGREHPYLKIGASVGELWGELNLSATGFKDEFLTNYFYPLSLVTIIQAWEYLTDRQMSQATRTRLDMKYAMHLPLNFPGVEPSTLCEFRQRVLADWNALEALQWMIHLLNDLANREKSAVGANRMVTSICLPSRVEHTLECMGMALEAVAATDPYWLTVHTLPHWYKRYHTAYGQHKIPLDPTEIKLLILSVGNDGRHLLKEIEKSKAAVLSALPEIQMLGDEWRQQFDQQGDTLKFHEPNCFSCSYEINIMRNMYSRKEEYGERGSDRGGLISP